MSQVPELLSPAGSLEKLKIVVLYGADAVYVGGRGFGLRAASENFTDRELAEGVAFAHGYGAKVFVTLNGLLHDEDLEELPSFCHFLQSIGVDAVICSDLGVMETVRRSGGLPIHLSTQASCLNGYSGKFWKAMGVSRLILGREVSLGEAGEVKAQTGLEVELFVHGAMCSSYSGHCVISNYTAGRDSNRGGCAHSCRFDYSLGRDLGKEPRQVLPFMSSKDLQGLSLLGQYRECAIDSIKIEGRMKGPLYGATVTKVYREALDSWPHWEGRLENWKEELRSFSHRDYTEASLRGSGAGSESSYGGREEVNKGTHRVLGTVVALTGEDMVVKVKNSFSQGSELEILPFKGCPFSLGLSGVKIKSLEGDSLSLARPSSLVRLPRLEGVERWNVVRARSSGELSC